MGSLGQLYKSWYGCLFRFNDTNRDAFIAARASELKPGSRVLDAGAGSCRYSSLFAHCDYRAQDFAKYEGSDHSYGDLTYISDITAIPEVDEFFDFILCTEVFEHIPRPDDAVRELSRLLRPGGELVITAPLGSAIHMPPYHFYGGFTPFWYQHFFALNHLSTVSIQPNGGFFKLYAQESQRFLGMLTPPQGVLRWMFFPIKLVLAMWFRLFLPLICHWLDRFDSVPSFTVGYFVRARKEC